jgi:ribosomal protein S18 acetylase RimI-like enzyme
MNVERAKPEDAQEVLDLQKLAYLSEAAIYGEYNIPPLTQTLVGIERDFQKQTVLKVTMHGRIVGSVRGYVSEGTCFVGRLIVHPDFQNQGTGTQLLVEIEAAFDQARRFELFTGHKSERNLHLYRKLGYRPFRSEQVTDNLTIVYLEKTVESMAKNQGG